MAKREKNMNNPRRYTRYLYDGIVQEYKDTILKKERDIRNVISKYFSKNSVVLSHNGPVEILQFNEYDNNIFFDILKISEKDIRKVSSATGYFVDKKNEEFKVLGNPAVLLMRAMIYVFYEKEGHKKALETRSTTLQIHLYFLAKLYGSMFFRSFNYGVNKEVMEYTIQNASNKFFIKKMNSMFEILIYLATSNMENMQEYILDPTDYGYTYYFNNLYNRISSLMKNIAQKFYDNNANNNRIGNDNIRKTNMEGEDYLDNVRSLTSDIENISRKIILRISSDSSVDMRLLTRATQKTKISINKMTSVIKSIKDSNDKNMQKLVKQILVYFLKNHKARTIKSSIFLNTMEGAYSISNTKDQNIIEIKENLDEILKTYSDMYLKTSRTATLSNMRLTVYLYFVYYIGKYCE